MTHLDCTKFVGRMRSICEGTSGLGPQVEEQYRRLWAANPPDVGSDFSCRHRGEQVSAVGCTGCGGNDVQVPVLACALFEECTLAAEVEGVRFCPTCTDRAPLTPGV
jgi:hypothetical protein